MEQRDGAENGKGSSCSRVIMIALNGGAKSKHIVRWAMEKFIPEGKVAFKLLHVFPKITGVPTPSKFNITIIIIIIQYILEISY